MSGLGETIKGIIDRVLHPEGHPRVAGVFSSPEHCIEAISALRQRGWDRLVVHSPLPSREIEEALGKKPSMVRYFTLTGALLGGAGGFTLAAWTSGQWNLIVSGKPIISVPPFLVITFETTILLGAIFTLVGFFLSTRIPQPRLAEIYRESFGDDTFGIGIVCGDGEMERAEAALTEAGAKEVYRAT